MTKAICILLLAPLAACASLQAQTPAEGGVVYALSAPAEDALQVWLGPDWLEIRMNNSPVEEAYRSAEAEERAITKACSLSDSRLPVLRTQRTELSRVDRLVQNAQCRLTPAVVPLAIAAAPERS